MKIPHAENLEGIFSLTWVLIGAGCFHLHAIDYNLGPMWLFYFIVVVVWWGVSLPFAISASRRGSPLNALCGRTALLLVCFYMLFIFIFTPRVHT
jgi:hypothetical protein